MNESRHTVWITLQSVDDRIATCRTCGARIRWAVTERGKKMPIDVAADVQPLLAGGYQVASSGTHWVTCANPNVHRRKAAPSERVD